MRIKQFIKAFLWGCLVIFFPVASAVIAGMAKLDALPTLFLQGGFMALSLAVPLICLLCGKWKLQNIGFGSFNAEGLKKTLFFIPLLTIFIPVAVSGLYIKSVSYALGSLFLYLFVGIAEELYFRGIVPHYLGKAFTQRGVIILSTVIFAVGHIATAFSGGGMLETLLTVFNAFIFGWLAIEVTLLSGNLVIPIMLHFFFDFETKIIAMNGTGLALAEGIRATLMFLIALWLAFVIRKTDKTHTITDEQQTRKRKTIKTVLLI